MILITALNDSGKELLQFATHGDAYIDHERKKLSFNGRHVKFKEIRLNHVSSSDYHQWYVVLDESEKWCSAK